MAIEPDLPAAALTCFKQPLDDLCHGGYQVAQNIEKERVQENGEPKIKQTFCGKWLIYLIKLPLLKSR